MKILITGSSGFLGSSLSTFLYKKGINSINTSRKDIKGSKKVENYMNTPDADIIIHLAQCNDRHFVNNQNSNYIKENVPAAAEIDEPKADETKKPEEK